MMKVDFVKIIRYEKAKPSAQSPQSSHSPQSPSNEKKNIGRLECHLRYDNREAGDAEKIKDNIVRYFTDALIKEGYNVELNNGYIDIKMTGE
jgi:hypothetical protein